MASLKSSARCVDAAEAVAVVPRLGLFRSRALAFTFDFSLGPALAFNFLLLERALGRIFIQGAPRVHVRLAILDAAARICVCALARNTAAPCRFEAGAEPRAPHPVGKTAPPSHPHKSSEPGDFDVYILAQSWLGAFCCSKPKQCPVPLASLDKDKTWGYDHLVLHGLWPSHSKGGWPSHCKVKSSAYKLEGSVPPLAFDFSPGLFANPGFAKHEWVKHGTCSGIEDPRVYMSESFRAMLAMRHSSNKSEGMDRGTPVLIKNNVGKYIKQSDLRKEYKGDVALKCEKQCQLSQVMSCHAKRPDGLVGDQISCPKPIFKFNDSCGHCDEIYIAKLGECKIPNFEVKKSASSQASSA